MRTVVSSAKSIENENLDVLKKFFIKTVKKGLWIEPFGTPCVIKLVSDLLVLYTKNMNMSMSMSKICLCMLIFAYA